MQKDNAVQFSTLVLCSGLVHRVLEGMWSDQVMGQVIGKSCTVNLNTRSMINSRHACL